MTVSEAAGRLAPGDTCLLHAGVYREMGDEFRIRVRLSEADRRSTESLLSTPMTLPGGGNSAPVTMALGIEEGILAEGDKSALLGIGSGINCLMLGVEW